MANNVPRILVTTSTFPRWKNDTEPSFVFDLCNYLHSQGMEIDVLAPHAHGAEQHEILDGINVYRYQYFFSGLQKLAYSGGILANLKKSPLNFLLVPFLLIFQTLALYRRLTSTEYQYIHAHWLIPQGFICALVNSISIKRGPLLICTSHGGDIYALDNYLFRIIQKWTIKRCTQLCVVSNAMKRKVAMLGIPVEKISVMPMGVDLQNEFIPVAGIERKDKRLIFVGRLVAKKGVDCLLEAMVNVVKTVPEVELLIVGDGPLRQTLEKQVVESGLAGHVYFYGSTRHDQLPELYTSASIAVAPSTGQEGLGLVIIEALGCHCAVIASSLESVHDVMDDDTGCFVNPGDAVDLAQKICFLLENRELRTQMAVQGRADVVTRFDRRVTGERYLKLMSGHQ